MSGVAPQAWFEGWRVRTRCVGLASVLLAGCAGSAAPRGAEPVDAFVIEAGLDGGATSLRARVDEVMAPAFDAEPASLEQCVGGVAVIVTPESELVGGWGATTLGGDVVPGETTLFQIGSVTKVFTGLAMARRVEEGDVTAETSAGALLAADVRDATPTWATMGALISHHAGLPAFPPNLVDRDGNGMRDPGIDPRSPAAGYGRSDLRAGLASWSPSSDAPYLYSNVGVAIVGIALADRLGAAGYHETLQRLVTADLGMRDTWGEVSAIPESERARLATGYVLDGMTRAVGIPGQMGVLASAGEIVTSGRDMRVWLRALVGLDETALSAAIRRATTPLADGPDGRSMGYAIEIEDVDGVRRYRKGGNTSSYGAFVLWSTEPAVGVAVLTNCGGFRRVVSLAEALHALAR
jgi:CubicO group peptidase (beta-lactamase class C family)